MANSIAQLVAILLHAVAGQCHRKSLMADFKQNGAAYVTTKRTLPATRGYVLNFKTIAKPTAQCWAIVSAGVVLVGCCREYGEPACRKQRTEVELHRS